MSASERGRWLGIAAEALALLVVIALVFAKLAVVATGSWRAVFLANGDSLVLPLVLQSLQRGEPFHWIFSSQTFFFPEFPLYAVCGLIMGTPQGGLVLNAILNVVLLYLGFRAITAAFAPAQRVRQVAVALSAVVLFLAAMLTESGVKILGAGTVEPARIATVFLMTTYYGGAILVSLGMLAAVFWVSNRFGGGEATRRRILTFGAVVVVIAGAITYSDPLYLLWFVAPLGLAVVVLLISRRLTLRWALILVFPQILGIGAGMLARVVFARFIAANLDHYVATFGAAQSADLLLGVLGGWLRSPAGILQLLILVVPIAVVLVFLARQLRRRGSNAARCATTAELFLALFIAISVLTLIAGQIATGQSVTRYLLPLFVFPPLALLLVRFDRIETRLLAVSRRGRALAAAAVAIGAIATLGITAPAVEDLASPKSPVDTACLGRWLSAQPAEGREVNGVGSFWTVRALALYGEQKGRLVQVALPLSIHAWMTNLSLYEGVKFSYALADNVVSGADLVEKLGKPASIVRCTGFRIYDYAATPGEAVLNASIHDAVRALKADHDY